MSYYGEVLKLNNKAEAPSQLLSKRKMTGFNVAVADVSSTKMLLKDTFQFASRR